jgi:tetratricopeptide (TPR) repeat protein
MRSPRRAFAFRALVLGLALHGCDKQAAGTDTPDDPGSRMEGSEGVVAGAAPGADGKPAQPGQVLPKVQDRDPEEEKRKMARSRAQSAKAEDALTSGRLDPAIEAAREALRLHEQNVHAMLVIAEAYYRQNKYEIVQAVITSALAVDPKIRTPAETSRLYNLQGFALLAMAKDSLATQSFKKAAENDDKNASAWNNLGTRYLEAGDVKTARSCFAYAVDLDARFYKAHLNLGAAQRAESQWKDAEASFLTALKLRPSYPEAYFDLGILYLDADPFPGLDATQRLNKSISYLTKYRELASASSSSRPAAKGTAAKSDPPAATREIADDYIRVAKKGLERLQRDAERDKTKGAPAEGGATPASEGGAHTGDTGDTGAPSGATPAPAGPQKPGTQTPGGASPDAPASPAKPEPTSPQKPGATTPTPSAPQKPGTGAPQSPGAGAPQTPAPASPSKPQTPAPVAPQKPPSAKPPSATPPSATPPSATPPSATPPSASPPPTSPNAKPTPTPVAPQKPPPQPVKPAPVAPQKPTSAALGAPFAPSDRAFAARDSIAAHTADRHARRPDAARATKKSLAARGTRGVDSTLSTSGSRPSDRAAREAALARLRLSSRPTTFARRVLSARTGLRDPFP